MGRPIKKKFFGNLNAPYNDYMTGGPTGGGGEGVASVLITGTNTLYVAVPTVTFAAPTGTAGVTATGTAHMAVVTLTSYNQTIANSVAGQTLTLAGGVGVEGTILVDSTQILVAPTFVNTGTNYVTGDVVTITGGTGVISTGTIVANALGNVTAWGTRSGGIYTTNPATLTGAATTSSGTGTALTVSFGMSIYLASLATGGDYTALPANVAAVSSGVNNPTWSLKYKVGSIAIATAGSGYATAPAITMAGNAIPTAVLGAAFSNALAVTAYLTTGSSAVAADIMKQEASHRYLVRNAQGHGQCKLISTSTMAAGEMNLLATDVLGSTYYVTKLTSRKALLVQNVDSGGGWSFVSNSQAGWTLGAASAGFVSVANF
jgi:hypothetical protein